MTLHITSHPIYIFSICMDICEATKIMLHHLTKYKYMLMITAR